TGLCLLLPISPGRFLLPHEGRLVSPRTPEQRPGHRGREPESVETCLLAGHSRALTLARTGPSPAQTQPCQGFLNKLACRSRTVPARMAAVPRRRRYRATPRHGWESNGGSGPVPLVTPALEVFERQTTVALDRAHRRES